MGANVLKPMILWTTAWVYGGSGDLIILENPQIWESIWREILPYKDIWTIKSFAGFESKQCTTELFFFAKL